MDEAPQCSSARGWLGLASAVDPCCSRPGDRPHRPQPREVVRGRARDPARRCGDVRGRPIGCRRRNDRRDEARDRHACRRRARDAADAAYVPPSRALVCSFRAATLCFNAVDVAPVADLLAGRARLIGSTCCACTAGTGNWSRTIRTILGPDDDAGRLLVGETINPPGNWSSYPPHKHDRHAPPDEVALEELYYYRFKPVPTSARQLHLQRRRRVCPDRARRRRRRNPVGLPPGCRSSRARSTTSG